MPQLSTNQVFMSYSRRDDVVMRRIVAFLRKQGIKVWVDNERLIPGTPIWEEEIEKAIKSASAVVVVLSPDSKNSEWVRREISLADQYRKRVFPVLVNGDEEKSISLRLINRQYVDIRQNENVGLSSLETALSVYLQESDIAQGDLENNKNPIQQITSKETLNVGTGITSALGKDNNQTNLWASLGWAFSGLISGFIYSEYDMVVDGAIGGLIGGAIGGLVTYFALQAENILASQKNKIRAILAWAIGGMIGWAIGWELTEAVGAGIGMAIFAIIGMVSSLRLDYILSNWKSAALITLGWAIGGAIGWSIAKGLIDGLSMDAALSWAIGTAIGWAIGGFIMNWQLTKR
ncbi:MAG: toll/interleukin-1 receptor domain-containing protein [Anaerolineales bacterium]|nr:toll/interleukin-1 receptor domain-containing protein [Anaerolineales bacterium]